jgi:putative tricarboxylic transport membrane protein
MYRDNKQLRPRRFMLFYSAIFPLLFLVATDVKAANPTADYPSRPITYVNHSSPGANSDIFSRLVSDIVQSEKMLSQPLFVLNRPGGNGGIAMEYLFQRKGNPHIILNVSSSVFISTTILEKLPFNITSFTPLVTMAADGGVVVVRNDSPFKTFDDIIAEARKRPKELVQNPARCPDQSVEREPAFRLFKPGCGT